MGRKEEIVKERLKKIKELEEKNIEVYPYYFDINASYEDVKKIDLKIDEKGKKILKVAGRVISKRVLGNICFFHIQNKEKLQIVLEKKFSKESLDFFKRYVDVGDFVGVEGVAYRTRTGEKSILAKNIKILCKAIFPLPEKWHGLKDVEERYRKRYLDLIMNLELKKVFEIRAKIINAIREFLNSKGFIEVEVPILQPVYGGATARPFITELHDLHMPMYLSISPELYLKRLLVGGFEKVYTISKCFRNEGIDKTHNPEFTMLEAYWAYVDYNTMIELFEEIFEYTMKKIGLKKKIKYQDFEISFERPWKKITVYEAIKKYLNVDVKNMSDEEIIEKAKELNILQRVEEKLKMGKVDSLNFLRAYIINELLDMVTPNFVQPTHLINHPLELTPLCKKNREDPRLIERCEPFIAGIEVGNIYSELNDPRLQEKLFLLQQKALKREAHPIDKDFLEALNYGMPPAGGLGLGIDRMVMILTNQPSIKDTILFPFMKPKE